MTSKKTDTKNYVELSSELEALLDKLQSGDISIDQALPAYQRGLEIIEQLEDQLQATENKITELKAQRPD